MELWMLARQEYPADAQKRVDRYLELMRAEGHIVKKTSAVDTGKDEA